MAAGRLESLSPGNDVLAGPAWIGRASTAVEINGQDALLTGLDHLVVRIETETECGNWRFPMSMDRSQEKVLLAERVDAQPSTNADLLQFEDRTLPASLLSQAR